MKILVERKYVIHVSTIKVDRNLIDVLHVHVHAATWIVVTNLYSRLYINNAIVAIAKIDNTHLIIWQESMTLSTIKIVIPNTKYTENSRQLE